MVLLYDYDMSVFEKNLKENRERAARIADLVRK